MLTLAAAMLARSCPELAVTAAGSSTFKSARSRPTLPCSAKIATLAAVTSSSRAPGKPPDVAPSCTTVTSLSVSTVISPRAPTKSAVSAVVPRLNCNCFAMLRYPVYVYLA